MINFNKKLKPINLKDLEAKFKEIKERKMLMDKRNVITYEMSIIRVGS